ncbi:MAG: hypothetical protein JSS35_18335 [Proteobacteria bacterium]|nr:hypothetical protein [Pseudomonadota bacterium]
MARLDIRPHSRRISAWAVAGLCLISAGAFAEGLSRQLNHDPSAAFPSSQFPSPQGPPMRTDLAAAATPAPLLPDRLPTRVRHAPAPAREDAASADAAAADAATPAGQVSEPAIDPPAPAQAAPAAPVASPPTDEPPR